MTERKPLREPIDADPNTDSLMEWGNAGWEAAIRYRDWLEGLLNHEYISSPLAAKNLRAMLDGEPTNDA